MLRERLTAMQNDPAIKTTERDDDIRISRRYPAPKLLKCSRCNNSISVHITEDCNYYFQNLVKLGVDCKLELLCMDCCMYNNYSLAANKDKTFVFKVRFNWWEKYVSTPVDTRDLNVLCHFFRNENKYFSPLMHTYFIGETQSTIDSIRKILDL